MSDDVDTPVDGLSPSAARDVGSVAQRIAVAVTEIDGVTGLYSGAFGEIATYLPGGRVGGVALTDDRGEVHVIVGIGHDLRDVAAEAARVAGDIAGVPVDVTVEDISMPGAEGAAADAEPDASSAGTSRERDQSSTTEVKNDG